MTTRTTARDGSRTYTVPDDNGDLIEVPSVTTVLRVVDKPALTYWAAKQVAQYAVENLAEIGTLVEKGDTDGAIRLLKGSPWSKRDKAADVGTLTHDALEQLALGAEVDIDPVVAPYVNAWRDFLADFSGDFEAAEMTVYNLTHGYAGTLDALYRAGGRLGCLDYKTRQGKKTTETDIYETERLQVAAYAGAEWFTLPDGSRERMPKVDGASVLMLCEDGYKIGRVELDADFAGFLAALRLWKWKAAL